jgi:hypothetical protein
MRYGKGRKPLKFVMECRQSLKLKRGGETKASLPPLRFLNPAFPMRFDDHVVYRPDTAFVLLQRLYDVCVGEARLRVATATRIAKRQWRFASDERAEHKRGAGGHPSGLPNFPGEVRMSMPYIARSCFCAAPTSS